MEENGCSNGEFGGHWATVVRAYCELMDAVIPHLPPAEQSLYHRLFRLSHVQQSPCTKCRYEELAAQCGLSLSTVRRAVKGFSPSLALLSRPPIYDAFSPEDRALFVECKQRLGPIRMNELTDTAVEWLTERARGNPELFTDEVLRDKIDELIFSEVFGPERRRPYEGLFMHLYQ